MADDQDREFALKSVQVLMGHAAELDSFHNALEAGQVTHKSFGTLKDVFKQMSDAAQECGSLVEHYDDEAMPENVRGAVVGCLDSLNTALAQLVLSIAKEE